jgi:uncharacterized membrane protein (DUF373 family)
VTQRMLDLEMPIIAAVNGPASVHSEYVLLAAIVAADTTVLSDFPHLTFGIVPGDGIHVTWEEAPGLDRAHYLTLTLTRGSFTTEQAEYRIPGRAVARLRGVHHTLLCVPDHLRGPEARLQRLLAIAEDGIHLVAAALLVAVAVGVAVVVVGNTVDFLRGPHKASTMVLSVINNTLILFIVAELLHTVRITIRDRHLNAEPFLVVGMIAGVRRVLIVTAEAEQSFRWNPKGIELIVLMGLILVMAVATWVWRRAKPPRDLAAPDQNPS